MITIPIRLLIDTPRYLVSIVVALCFPFSAINAMEWRNVTEIPLAVEFNDNLYYSSSDRISDVIYHAGLHFRLDGSDEQNQINLAGGIDAQRLRTTKTADNEFYSARARFLHLMENSTAQLTANYEERSTRTSELQSIGVVNIFGKVKIYNLIPSLELEANDLNRLLFSVDISRNDYDIDSFIDYKNYQGQILWTRIFSENTEGGIDILLQRYDAVLDNIDYDYGSLHGTLSSELSNNFSNEIALGIGYVLRKTGDNYKTLLFSLTTQKELQYTRIAGSLSSNLAPTSAGQITRLTTFELNLTHNLTDYNNLTITGRASRSDIVSSLNPYTTDYLLAEVSYLRQQTDWITFDVSYTYTTSVSTLSDSRRSANIVYASLTLLFDS